MKTIKKILLLTLVLPWFVISHLLKADTKKSLGLGLSLLWWSKTGTSMILTAAAILARNSNNVVGLSTIGEMTVSREVGGLAPRLFLSVFEAMVCSGSRELVEKFLNLNSSLRSTKEYERATYIFKWWYPTSQEDSDNVIDNKVFSTLPGTKFMDFYLKAKSAEHRGKKEEAIESYLHACKYLPSSIFLRAECASAIKQLQQSSN